MSKLTPLDQLRAHLAEAIGFEPSFSMAETGVEDIKVLCDAECATVPSLEDMLLHNPKLVAKAFTWLLDNVVLVKPPETHTAGEDLLRTAAALNLTPEQYQRIVDAQKRDFPEG